VFAYITGDIESPDILNDVWSFSADTMMWTQVSTLSPAGRLGAAAAAHDDVVYFFGGLICLISF
jgi:N-acetylneuraminic acid mutarotase